VNCTEAALTPSTAAETAYEPAVTVGGLLGQFVSDFSRAHLTESV
jgi:hypothetical protein